VTSTQRYAIVVGRFYEDLAEKLVASALEVFEAAGGKIDVFDVPGAYELPLAAKYCAETGRYAGVAAGSYKHLRAHET
jgi:6,7-dimethyl-8-ribityllumazine synthase